MPNFVFIATSLDGYIADKDGNIDWLDSVPNPEGSDLGYNTFIDKMDAIVMGRNSFDMVCNFDIDWPYHLPVFVMSRTLTQVPAKLKDKVQIIAGSPTTLSKQLKNKGFDNLYIDGGKTIQSFLREDLIDELIITVLPSLRGGGIPLFGELPTALNFQHLSSEVYLNALVQNHYRRSDHEIKQAVPTGMS